MRSLHRIFGHYGNKRHFREKGLLLYLADNPYNTKLYGGKVKDRGREAGGRKYWSISDCEQFKFTAEAQRVQSKTILGINELNKGILGTAIGLLSEKRVTIHCGFLIVECGPPWR